MELSNEFVENLFFKQIKELTIRSNKQLRSLKNKNSENSEEDFYSKEYLEKYLEEDEINGAEEGFMMGYLG